MNKKFILIFMLVLSLSMSVACEEKENAEDTPKFEIIQGESIDLTYAGEYQKDIFGNLDPDKMLKIVMNIVDKLYTDEYKENKDLAIEDAFKEYGITDETQIKNAKDYLQITKNEKENTSTNKLIGRTFSYERKYEKDIFGDMSMEEIQEIINDILDKISEHNTDLVIEEVFKDHGITDKIQIKNAKKYFKINK